MKRVPIKEKNNHPLLTLQGLLNTLPSVEYRISKFILSNPQETVNSTIEELAEKTNSSYATICRFCKKLGFSGFKEFKNGIIADVMKAETDSASLMQSISHTTSSSAEVIQEIFRFTHQLLDDTSEIINKNDIDTVVNHLLKAKKIVFIGAGTSGISAKYAYTKFFRLGLNCLAEIDSILFSMHAGLLCKNDLLLAISSSGRTSSVVDAARLASQRNATVISLSDYALSPLTEASTINLFTTPRNTNLYKEIEMPLLISQITIIDILYSCACLKMKDKANSLHKQTKEIADLKKL